MARESNHDCLFNQAITVRKHECKKRIVISTIVFLTRIATVDMVLWDDTRKSLVTASYGQYSAHGVATGTTVSY